MCMLSWESLLPEWSFRDLRLRARTLVLLEALRNAPGQAFGGVFDKKKKDVKAAYDFCENDAVTFHSLLTPTFITTGRVIREEIDEVLVVQDTTELELTSLKATKNLGELGNPKNRGIFLHAGLAVTPSGVPVGLVSALTWTRDPEEHGKAARRSERAFDDKESAKWWKTIVAAERVVASPGKLVHIGDRESDVFDVMARCLVSGYRGLFRAAQDRLVLDGAHTRLWAEVESWRVVGKRQVDIPARAARPGQPARAARCAELALRFGTVKIAQPESRHGFVELCAVLVREEDPPSPDDVIEWLLLTTDVLTSAAAAWKRVDWYRRRWLIEEFHKCLKTTCRIEARQFKDRPHFETYLALVMLVSMRILFLRNIARVEPDAPAAQVVTPEEESVLRAYFDDGARVAQPAILTSAHVVRLIANLGGFLARKGDGEPGFQALSKGFSKLALLISGVRLARRLPALPERPLDTATFAYFGRRDADVSPH